MSNSNQNIYECPEGCKAQGERPIAASIRGWKKHMTRQHQGYTQEQLDAIVGATPPSSQAGKDLFLSEFDDADKVAPHATDGVAGEGGGSVASPDKTVEVKTDAAARKLSAKMNKMQAKFAKKIPEIMNNALKSQGDEWQMADDDKETLAEAIENCFEVLDVEFRVAPISKVLTNPLWVFMLPIFALLLIFLPKAMKNLPQLQGKIDAENSTVN